MSMIRAAASSGGGAGEDHELLIHRYGIGPDGVAWHLDTETYNRVINMQYYRGFFPDEEALKEAYPRDVQGAYAIVLSTGTFWFWEGLERGWVDTGEAVTQVIGLPPGGVTGQVLAKKSDVDNDVEWADGGTGSGVHNDLSGLQGGLPSERFHLSELGSDKVDQWLRNAPDRPTNISPEEGAIDVAQRPWFVSSDYYHPYNYPMYGYNLQLLNSAGDVVFDSGLVEQSVVIWMPGAGVLEEGTTYQWRVRYCGTNFVSGEPVWSAWSEATRFAAEAVWSDPTIMTPRIIYPGDGSTLTTATPLLITSPFDEGSGLTQVPGPFQIARDAGFTNVVDQGTGMTSYTSTTELTRGAQHFARARHCGEDGEGGVHNSPWSPRVGFIIRNFYRSTRIGLVLDDPVNWVFRRIGEDWSEVSLDGGYFPWHPVYALIEATKGQLIDGQALSSVPKTWIYSDNAPSGPYAGKKVWMIDTDKPSDAELAAGWHLHGAFASNDFGEQDVLNISRYFCMLDSSLLTADPNTPNGAGISYAQALNGIAARNSDQADPLKRGWHVTPYYEIEFIKLMTMIEKGQLIDALPLITNPGLGFHGMWLGATAFGTANNWLPPGLGPSWAWMPGGGVTKFGFPNLCDSAVVANTSYSCNDITHNSDGPEGLHLGDYLIGTQRLNSINNPSPDGSKRISTVADPSTEANAFHYVYPNVSEAASTGFIGSSRSQNSLPTVTSQYLFKMSKWG